MSSIRIGFSTDFNLKDEQVGIGTEFPTARLEVRGNILAENILDSGGISTITRYDGFLNPDLILTERTTSLSITDKGNLNTLSGEIKIEGEVTVEEGTPLAGGRLDSLTITGKFDLPQGGSEDREDTPEKGSTRFNEDLGQLEFYTGLEWRTVGSIADTGGRGRGVFGGGLTPTKVSTIDYINIQSRGNAVNFGNLTVERNGLNACSSSTRGIYAAGYNTVASNDNTIDYITIASEGNAIDFGDRTVSVRHPAGLSSSTRGLFGGGFSDTNVIDYITIATIGSALDFGDLTQARHGPGACSSSTRGIFAGGNAPNITQVMEYVTIASTGNAVDFGDLSEARGYPSGSSNSTRGIFSNGFKPGTYSKTIDYLTIATLGNAVEFGNTSNTSYGAQGCATQTRAIVSVGEVQSPASTILNVIEYVEINTKSNAFDFGDLSVSRYSLAACSDSHGGLGGF